MNANDLIAEIHHVREKQAAECGYDPRRIGERLRRRQQARAAEGVRYASFVLGHSIDGESLVVREESGAH